MAVNKKTKAAELDAIVRERTKDQVRAIIDIGMALVEIYNEQYWSLLRYRSWADYCERAADLRPSTADRYIDVAITFGDYEVPEHMFVGITKLMIIRKVCINKTQAMKWLRIARDNTCDTLKEKVRREVKILRRKGHVVREMTNRTKQMGLGFTPEEEREFRAILEEVKEADNIHLNGEATLALARFWHKNHRVRRAA